MAPSASGEAVAARPGNASDPGMKKMDAAAGAERTSRAFTLLTLAWALGLVASGWAPRDRATWWMEIAPALIAWPVLLLTRRRFPLSSVAMTLICLHGLILMVGGTYTYARVPFGVVLQDWLHLSRNPYDRIGHFMQGFVPAVVIRELFVRSRRMRPGMLLATTVVAYCLAISAAYELVEFGAAMALGQGADEFLGTQGDPWDTQWDMLTCLMGALTATAAATVATLIQRNRERGPGPA